MLVEQADGVLQDKVYGRFELFEYPESEKPYVAQSMEGLTPSEDAAAEQEDETAEEAAPASPEVNIAMLESEFERRLKEEARRAFELGCEQGRLAEREAQDTTLQQSEEQRKRQAVELVGRFQQECDRYLHAVEQEVVRLSLAVASRILRRESQMDPLLLTGAVRVALGQLASTSEVKLRVPQQDLQLWQDAVVLLPNLNPKPEVLAQDGLQLGDCVIETVLGSVDLGLRAQLAEIERGFFDRSGSVRNHTTKEEQAEAGR
ncbi:FliH/SctL family protein [Telmatobacter bradus]|uniref:FliH/SctL family protein n=1 Tax=Telmatobacter bradus TaxID=474953 RepID=UPI003B43502B